MKHITTAVQQGHLYEKNEYMHMKKYK